MQAIIIAAGESSRFWPLNSQHKSQIKVLGRSLISWTVKSIAERNIKDIIVVSGPNNVSALKEELSPLCEELGVSFSFIIQEKPLGTGNAIYQAKNLIKGGFFVFWPYKIIAGRIIDEVLKNFTLENMEIVLVSTKTENPGDYGMLKMEEGKVLSICENPEKEKTPSRLKTTGAYFFQKEFFDYYEKVSKHHPEDFIDAMNLYIKEKKAGNIIWEIDMPSLKYPWHALEIMKFAFNGENFRNFIAPTAQIDPSTLITGPVNIGEKVVIGPNCSITGPCYIGDNCKIGADNVLRGPVDLERDVITGAFFEIKNCLIQEGTHFHSGYIGDSVIGKNCRFGAGFITANKRIDRKNILSKVKGEKKDTGIISFGFACGDNVKAGIHSGTMPGVLIGHNSLIGPGTIVFENVEEETTFYTEFKKIKKKD